jgi:hypothetical protein
MSIAFNRGRCQIRLALLFLVLENIDQSANVRRDLHRELVASFQRQLRSLTHPHSSWSSRDDDRTSRERRAVRQKAG